MKTIHIESATPSKTGKSLLIKAGGSTYFAKPDSGLSAGMTIEAETKESEYQGKVNVWIDKWKEAANAAPAHQPAAAPPYWMPFVSNVVAHAIQAGIIQEPAQISAWATSARNWATGSQEPF